MTRLLQATIVYSVDPDRRTRISGRTGSATPHKPAGKKAPLLNLLSAVRPTTMIRTLRLLLWTLPVISQPFTSGPPRLLQPAHMPRSVFVFCRCCVPPPPERSFTPPPPLPRLACVCRLSPYFTCPRHRFKVLRALT